MTMENAGSVQQVLDLQSARGKEARKRFDAGHADRVELTGRDLVPPNTACIFMANHVSNLDPPALLPSIPGRTSAFLKRSLMRIPVLGWGFQLGEFIPVDRDGRKEGRGRRNAKKTWHSWHTNRKPWKSRHFVARSLCAKWHTYRGCWHTKK
jgi:hypothetical protein